MDWNDKLELCKLANQDNEKDMIDFFKSHIDDIDTYTTGFNCGG